MKRFTIVIINLCLIGAIAARVIAIGNDKAHLIYLFYYPLICVTNFLITGILHLLKQKIYQFYLNIGFWLIGLFIPGYFVVLFL